MLFIECNQSWTASEVHDYNSRKIVDMFPESDIYAFAARLLLRLCGDKVCLNFVDWHELSKEAERLTVLEQVKKGIEMYLLYREHLIYGYRTKEWVHAIIYEELGLLGGLMKDGTA